MPVYRPNHLPKNKRQIVVHHQGHRRDRIFTGSSGDAKSEEARLLRELETTVAHESSGKKSKSAEPNHSGFCQAYADHTSTHVAKSTWDTRKFHVQNLDDFVHLLIGKGELPKDFRFSEWADELFDRYKAHRRRDRKVKRSRRDKKTGELKKVDVVIGGAGGRTINNEQKTFSTMKTFARRRKWPVPDVELKKVPEVGERRVKFWVNEEIVKLYRVCSEDLRGRRLLPILVFLANTGCRKGEAIHAEREWVKEKTVVTADGKVVEVSTLSIEPNDHWQPKDGEARDIPISDALDPYLRLPEKNPKYLFVSSRPDAQGNYRPYKCFPNKTFRRLVKQAGLRGGPHKLRHSYASAFLAAEPDMHLLSKILGHSHEKVTKLYAHLLPSHRERARNKVNVGPAMGAASFEAAERWKTGRRR